MKEARKLYELAIKRFVNRDDVWIAYLEFERKTTKMHTETSSNNIADSSDSTSDDTPVTVSALSPDGNSKHKKTISDSSFVPLANDSPEVITLLSRRLRLQQLYVNDL